MKRALQVAVAVVSVGLMSVPMLAQRRSINSGGGHNASATASHGSGNWSASQPHYQVRPQMRPQAQYSGHRSIGTVYTAPYVNPFQQQIHLDGPGAGCANCGYAVYGGWVYPGAYPLYDDNPQPVVNNTPAPEDNPPASTTADDYIYERPETAASHFDDANNLSPQNSGQMVSAASTSPAILVFKDGTSKTVENYAIYGAYILVIAPAQQKIPIAALDIAATEKANESAGYDLKLPAVFTSH